MEYLGIGALVTYATWPFLWPYPLRNYLTAISIAANYPWKGNILFQGSFYLPQQLPAGYIPILMGLQFTETALLLFLVGLILALIYWWEKAALRLDLLLLGAWFFIPVVAVILLRSTIYNNFRQFLFVTPPLFVIAGFALQGLWERLRQKTALFFVLAAIVLLPAFYWCIRLYPYEYIYYNSLAGGMSGAFHKYENDYWIVSFKEAVEYINQVAKKNATVYIKGINFTSKPYARPDLQLDPTLWEVRLEPKDVKAGYAILPAGFYENEKLFPGSPVVYQIQRDGNILAVVKEVRPGDTIVSPKP